MSFLRRSLALGRPFLRALGASQPHGPISSANISSANISAFMPEAAAFPGVRDYPSLQLLSLRQAERFWAALARDRLSWISPFHTASDCDLARGKVRWFEGGRLNVSGELVPHPGVSGS